jgi:hypothetical protein
VFKEFEEVIGFEYLKGMHLRMHTIWKPRLLLFLQKTNGNGLQNRSHKKV